MNKILRDKLETNHARLERARRWDEFSTSLGSEVGYSVEAVEYASFEKTRRLLLMRDIALTGRGSVKRQGLSKAVTTALLRCFASKLGESECWVIGYGHFEFIGALRLQADSAFETVWGLLAIGEESVLITDLGGNNAIDVDVSESIFDRSMEYDVAATGTAWTPRLRECG